MKIWIDFINTPQVQFFDSIYDKLTKDGHQLVLTCRDSSNTVDMLEMRGWPYVIINGYSGGNKFLKYLFFPLRTIRLLSFISGKRIDRSICQSSFYLPIVSRLLGIRSIYLNDNEHAMGNTFAFLFAHKIFFPSVLEGKNLGMIARIRKDIKYYPGIKEAIYLSAKEFSRDVSPNVIYFRPEPDTAQYYTAKIGNMDELLIKLSETETVTILPRSTSQYEYYSDGRFSKCRVLAKPIALEEIVYNCKLFIGAGGSMSRELATLGIKVISTYQGELLHSDRYLINYGLMAHEKSLSVKFAEEFMSEEIRQPKDGASVLKLGEKAEADIFEALID